MTYWGRLRESGTGRGVGLGGLFTCMGNTKGDTGLTSGMGRKLLALGVGLHGVTIVSR